MVLLVSQIFVGVGFFGLTAAVLLVACLDGAHRREGELLAEIQEIEDSLRRGELL